MKVITDANIFIAILHTNDPQHTKAAKLVNSLKTKNPTFILNRLILTEIFTVLLQRTKDLDFCSQSCTLLTNPKNQYKIKNFTAKLEKQTYQIFFSQPQHHLSVADCSLIAQAKDLKTKPVLTLDNNLNKSLPYFGLKAVLPTYS